MKGILDSVPGKGAIGLTILSFILFFYFYIPVSMTIHPYIYTILRYIPFKLV